MVDWVRPTEADYGSGRRNKVWTAIEQLQGVIDELDAELARHAQGESEAPASEAATEKAYEEGKAIAEPLLAATGFALAFERGRVKVLSRQCDAMCARCERLARVIRAFTAQGDTVRDSELAKALSALLPSDLDPSKPD